MNQLPAAPGQIGDSPASEVSGFEISCEQCRLGCRHAIIEAAARKLATATVFSSSLFSYWSYLP
jgi:hypothetical protein